MDGSKYRRNSKKCTGPALLPHTSADLISQQSTTASALCTHKQSRVVSILSHHLDGLAGFDSLLEERHILREELMQPAIMLEAFR